jgi:serine/threonine-protein kinase
MSQPDRRPDSARNLLFGILALQVNFIGRDTLIAAVHAWVGDKGRPLAQVLIEQGHLTAGQCTALDLLLVQYLQAHGDDAEQSLRALPTVREMGDLLAPVADADVQSTLAHTDSVAESSSAESGPARNGDGRYRVLRPHAGGGLGLVYVAEDTELHREVALKEIRPELADNPASRRRFVLEAEITGALEHPGVVPVYGLGAYPDGRPYYAMRFIHGTTLKAAIADFHAADRPGRDPGKQSLAFRHLLRRFIDMCNAVAYAHSRRVLHRDLKPANVMLGKFGETLVVDWGLAKAGVRPHDNDAGPAGTTRDPTVHPASTSNQEATQPGAAMGTPAFMSPEQADGRLDELSPASDIYSLGATFYALLTGRPPFDGADKAEVLACVRGGQFAPPRQVSPQTPPALDAICRKSMALRPGDRYRTALDLAADVEHWLADEPVGAYRDPLRDRIGRWARRHRTAVVAAGVLLLSAVAALSVSTALVWHEQRNTAEQRRIAEKNYGLSRTLSFRVMDLIEGREADLAAVPARDAARKESLKAASAACRQLLPHQGDDTELRSLAAKVYRYTANVHRLTNETADAGPLYAESVELYKGLAAQYPDEAGYRLRLGETLRDQASLQARVGQLREAADTLGRSVELAELLWAEEPDRPTYRRALAAGLLERSSVELKRGAFAEAAMSARRAAELFGGLLAQVPAEAQAYDGILLAAAQNIIAVTERELDRTDSARSLHAEAVTRIEGVRDARPDGVNRDDVRHFECATRLEQAQTWARTAERRAKAETNAGATAVVWEALAKKYPSVPTYREALASAYLVRGEVRAADNRPAVAREDFERSRALSGQLANEFPELPEYHVTLGRACAGLARLERSAGNRADAVRWYGRAEATAGKAVAQSPDGNTARRLLARIREERER